MTPWVARGARAPVAARALEIKRSEHSNSSTAGGKRRTLQHDRGNDFFGRVRQSAARGGSLCQLSVLRCTNSRSMTNEHNYKRRIYFNLSPLTVCCFVGGRV